MANTSFDELVKREQRAAESASYDAIDWQRELSVWFRHLDDLFEQIQGFLDDYVRNSAVKILLDTVELNEEQVGSYRAPQMTVVIGTKTVKLEPVGTFIIGSKGRVDVVGPQGRARLLLLDGDVKRVSQLIRVSVSTGGSALPPPPPSKDPSSIQWVWRIMSRPPKMEIIELNKENFLALLVEIANG